MNIQRRVANLTKKFGTANPYIIASHLKIKVIEVDLPDTVRGIYTKILRRKFILVNKSLPEDLQKIVVCHELGHARLHTGYNYFCPTGGFPIVRSKKEIEASTFAACLLSHSTELNDTTLEWIFEKQASGGGLSLLVHSYKYITDMGG